LMNADEIVVNGRDHHHVRVIGWSFFENALVSRIIRRLPRSHREIPNCTTTTDGPDLRHELTFLTRADEANVRAW